LFLVSCQTTADQQDSDGYTDDPELLNNLEKEYEKEDEMRQKAWSEIRKTLALLSEERILLEQERQSLQKEKLRLDEKLSEIEIFSLENEGLLKSLEQINKEQNRESQRLEELGSYLKKEKLNLENEESLLNEKNHLLGSLTHSLKIKEMNIARTRETVEIQQKDLDNVKLALDARQNALDNKELKLTEEQKALDNKEQKLTEEQNVLENKEYKLTEEQNKSEEKEGILEQEQKVFYDERKSLDARKVSLSAEQKKYEKDRFAVQSLLDELNREKTDLDNQQQQLMKEKNSISYARRKLEQEKAALETEAVNAKKSLVFFESYALSSLTGFSEEIADLISKMSLEEKVGQIFLLSLQEPDGSYALKYKGESREIIKEINPGGVHFFKPNINNMTQLTSFIDDLKSDSTIPLFVSVDEEGGLVSRITGNKSLHATKMSVSQTVGKSGDPVYAYKAGQVIGSELYSLGFNMNMAPVADINTNPENPVIGVRSFSNDPYITGTMVAAQALALKYSHIIPVIKHFPGHGDTATDSHFGMATVEHTAQRLEEVELIPFKMGLESGVDVVMTGHIVVKSYEKKLPATFSSKILQGILRKKMGFEGIIMTDSMGMGAITNYFSHEEAPVMAFLAGVDMILTPDLPLVAYKSLLSAVCDGRISERRLDESVKRILWVKFKYGLFNQGEESDPEKVLGSDKNKKTAYEIRKSGR